jgi:glyoxylase-like metal-dependent hydrolase (beta-lactamase superfamily II)
LTTLLHGMTGSGDAFSAGWDHLAEHGRLVVPDLLGFVHSMDEQRTDFSLQAHLDALDAVADQLGLDDGPLVVAGYSMGGVLALHWAARRPSTRRVVAFCAPLYADLDEADRHIRQMGWREALFALEGRAARLACAWMCRWRQIARWLAVAISPQWPVALARQGVEHTWLSHLGGMNGIIRKPTWRAALEDLVGKQVKVVLVRDGEMIELGDVALEVLHTPGHTPEHVSLLVRDREQSEEPALLRSGGALLVGDLARPDLLGGEEQARVAARAFCRTIQERLLALPDHVEVWPTHVAGSLCGGNIGSRLSTTVGYERRTNAILAQVDSTDGRECLRPEDLPAVPPYWRRMRQRNLAGVERLGVLGEPRRWALTPSPTPRSRTAPWWSTSASPRCSAAGTPPAP